MNKDKRKKNNEHIFSPRTPEENSRKIIGVVWNVDSMSIAEQAIPETQQTIKRFEVKPGPHITAYEFYAANGTDGSHVILLGYGTMFSAQFLYACRICIVEVYHGVRITDPERILAWVDELTPRWQEDCREDRKKQAAMRRVARSLFPKKHKAGFANPMPRNQQTGNGTASAPRGRTKFRR